MILRSAPASPFGRKVKIAAALLGLPVSVVEADTTSPTDSLRRENPLGKIPTLILDDGTTLFDSSVIVAYLDAAAGGDRLVPAEIGPRFAALRLEALADGLADAALLQVYEGRWRAADRHDAAWVEHQAAKVERALAALEAAPPAGPVTSGRSRWPARSATSTCASPAAGGTGIPRSSPGSRASPPRCRPSRRAASSRPETRKGPARAGPSPIP